MAFDRRDRKTGDVRVGNAQADGLGPDPVAQPAAEDQGGEAEHAQLCIGETGFGTGLNFLCAWQLFEQRAPGTARLHFVSVEKYPLTRNDLQRALALWPGFATLAAVQVLRRGLHYAVDRPVREMLYIPLGPGMKYKAKSFIDTFVYRAGDLAGIWMTPILAALAWPLALPALGASLLWLGSAVGLGRKVKAPFKG